MDTPPTTADARPARLGRRRRSRVALWLVLLAVGGACIGVTYKILADRARAGIGMPAYSVYSDDADGFAQAAAFLRKLGWQPIAVTRPIYQTRHRGLLILSQEAMPLAESAKPTEFSDAEIEGMLHWIGQGNTMLLCGPRNTRLHRKLDVSISEDTDSGDTVYKATPGAVGEYTARIASIGVERPNTVSARRAVPLWSFGNKPAAVVVRHGAGRVLILPDPSVLTHRGLLREDNAVFLYNVAALDAEDGKVYFDEYHHGIRAGGGYWTYLRYHGQHWILLQLVLIAGIALWAAGRRLGPAVPLVVTRQADGVDYASSVARIYEKADVRPLVAKVFARHFLDALTKHLRLRRNAEPREIMMAWKQRENAKSVRELEQLLDTAEAMLTGQAAAAKQLLAIAQELDSFLDEYVTKKR